MRFLLGTNTRRIQITLERLYAYSQDKNETYVVMGDGVRNVDGIYKFYAEKGKTI